MILKNIQDIKQNAQEYDPFERGRFPVGVRTIHAFDKVRNRTFPCEIWYPAAAPHAGYGHAPETRDAAAQPGTYPLILFSHASARGARRMSTFLCTHLSSHGYIVAALDHFEVVAVDMSRRDGETDEQKTARAEAWVANRVPDIRFLLDHLLNSTAWNSEAKIDPVQIGIVGYSFGGWTVLATPEVERRVQAVVALAPGGSSRPKPGILPGKLTFIWGRDVPTLYLVAENDVMTPLTGMYELFERTAGTKRMVILRCADHLHFHDYVEQEHETARTMPWPVTLAWIPKEMKPIAELCSGEQSHLFVRGLTVCHMDETLKGKREAQQFLDGDIEVELAARGVDVIVHKPIA